MGILAPNSLVNPLPPPMPPRDYLPILGFYMVYDSCFGKSIVVKAGDNDVALEMARYLCGDSGTYYIVYDNASASFIIAIEMLKLAGYKQAYVSPDGQVVEYKTRKDVIDEILVEL